MDVLLWFPTVSTVTCCGGALGADGSHREGGGGKRLKKEKVKKKERMKSLHIVYSEKRVCLVLFISFFICQRGICLTRYLNSY